MQDNTKLDYFKFHLILLKNFLTYPTSALSDVMDYIFYAIVNDGEDFGDGRYPEKVAKYLGLTFRDIDKSLKKGKMIYDSISPGSVMISINRDTIWDFYSLKKTEREKVNFLAICAVQSILGRKTVCKINNNHLFNRMACNTESGGPIPEALMKYNTRRKLDRIKEDLQTDWGLKIYGTYTRGFYVSFSMDMVSLTQYAESRRRSNRIKALKEEKKVIRLKVLNSLNSPKNVQ